MTDSAPRPTCAFTVTVEVATVELRCVRCRAVLWVFDPVNGIIPALGSPLDCRACRVTYQVPARYPLLAFQAEPLEA